MRVPLDQTGQQQQAGTRFPRHMGRRLQIRSDAFDTAAGYRYVDRRAIGKSNVV